MRGPRLAVYGLLLLVFIVLADWGLRTRDNATTQDAELVYCLAPAHLDGLVNAGAALGVVGPGSQPSTIFVDDKKLSLSQWRAADGGDFQRACDAYATANMSAQPAGTPNGVEATLEILLPVIAGALLTMAADDVRRASDRRKEIAGQLRANWQAFETAATSFARDCAKPVGGGLQPTGDLDAKRRAAQEALRMLPSSYRKLPAVKALQDDLSRGPLGPSIATGWDGDAAGKVDRLNRVTESLSPYRDSVESVAEALERRLW